MSNIKVISFKDAEGRLKEIYQDLIDKRGMLAGVHMVQSLNPESIIAHMNLYMVIMFNHSPLSREQRELMAVMVSVANCCVYCQKHHAVALNKYWKNKERINQLVSNYTSASLSPADTLLCRYALALTGNPSGNTGQELVRELSVNGFDDRAILDATLVIAYFNFVNRIVLALDVQLEESAGEGFHY